MSNLYTMIGHNTTSSTVSTLAADHISIGPDVLDDCRIRALPDYMPITVGRLRDAVRTGGAVDTQREELETLRELYTAVRDGLQGADDGAGRRYWLHDLSGADVIEWLTQALDIAQQCKALKAEEVRS